MDDVCEDIFIKIKEEQFFMFNTDPAYQDALRYLRSERYLDNPGGPKSYRFIPLELGKKVIAAGGWKAYKKEEKKKEELNDKNLRLSVSLNTWSYWSRWIPITISLIAVAISILSMKQDKVDKEKLKQEILKELRNNNQV